MNLIAEGPAQFQLRLGVTLTSGAPVIRLMTLTWAVLLGLYVGVGRAQTPSAAQDAVTAPKCGLPASAESRGALDLREKSLLYDEFKSTTLGPEYEIRDGPGFFELVGSEEISSRAGLGRVLRYYALPRGVQFSAETELINIETLGRPYVPSLLVGRPFRGETWTFDSKIAFGFQQASNGRAIHLWIAFGDLTERSMNSVKITRYNDNPGRPQERGSLGVGIYSSGKQVGSKPILLNPEDTYFFCVRRAGRLVQVLVSSDGTKYAPVLDHTFGPEIDQKTQWIIVNGMAFAPGAHADLEYLSVRVPATSALLPSPSTRTILRKYGQPRQRLNVDAEEIIRALRDGHDIDVEHANLNGILDLAVLRTVDVRSHITFKFCSVSALAGSGVTFHGDVSFIGCDLGNVNFSTARFLGKADFSSSLFLGDTRFILSEFARGADFSGTTFKSRVWFRLGRFHQPTSFYYSTFEDGADISSVVFEKDVSFADFSFAKPEAVSGVKPDVTFFGSAFGQRALFISSLQRPIAPLGSEISFQQAQIKDLILSSGDPDPFSLAGEQTGRGLWVVASNIVLLAARLDTLTFKNVAFTGITDLRGVEFKGSGDSVRWLNADFATLKVDSWPVGKVLATAETRDRVISSFEEAKNTVASRQAFFDLLAGGRYYERWLKDKDGRPKSYRDYLGYRVSSWGLSVFRAISGYGTSLARTFLTGLVLTIVFGIVFVFLDRGRGHLVRIEKPMELKTRVSETPVVSFGEKVLEREAQATVIVAVGRVERILATMRMAVRSAMLAFFFSLNTVAKIGFGNIRVRMGKGSPRSLVAAAWIAWLVGYAWYALLVYTVSVIPALSGLF